MQNIIHAAINNGFLHQYNLATAQVGDKVLGFNQGKVIAIHCEHVVIGWDTGKVSSFTKQDDPCIYLAPLAWVEDRPVYTGDVLYGKWPGNQSTGYIVVAHSNNSLFWDDKGRRTLLTDNMDDLTWTKQVTTIKINGHDVLAPERVAPPVKTVYWVPSVGRPNKCDWFNWKDDACDRRLLTRGLVHLTEEAALAHAEALLSFTEGRDV